MSEFKTEDSGQRLKLANGMLRDITEGKTDYMLILKGPMHQRWAELMTRGASKYGKWNWCKALDSTDKAAREQVKDRFKESALRHMMQWVQGDRSEDHAAAVYFNLNGYEAMLETDNIAAVSQVTPTVIPAAAQQDLLDTIVIDPSGCWCGKPVCTHARGNR